MAVHQIIEVVFSYPPSTYKGPGSVPQKQDRQARQFEGEIEVHLRRFTLAWRTRCRTLGFFYYYPRQFPILVPVSRALHAGQSARVQARLSDWANREGRCDWLMTSHA